MRFRTSTRHRPPASRAAISRRDFLKLGVASLPIATGAEMWTGTERPRLVTHEIDVDGLDREYRLLHVSDLHERRFGPAQSDIARLLEGRRYDAAVLTGDYVNRGGRDSEALSELLGVLGRHAPVTLSVLGNHDGKRAARRLAAGGVRQLDGGDVVLIGDLTIAGRAKGETMRSPTDAASSPLVVIASHIPPSAADIAAIDSAPRRSALVLCGHTHGGHIRLPLVGAIVAPRKWKTADMFARELLFPDLRGMYTLGMYADAERRRWVHVSPGLGGWLPRILTPAEITEIRLVPQR